MHALLDHLEKIPAFVAIGRAGSLQKAAESLRRSQPSLSKTVKVLEEALGVELLRRGRHGATLTSAGHRLFAFGEQLLTLALATEREFAPNAEPVGALRVIHHELIAGFVWPTLLSAAAIGTPKIKLELLTHSSAREMARHVERGECELAIGAELPDGPKTVRTLLYEDRYGLFARTGFGPADHAAVPKHLIFSPRSIAGATLSLAEALHARGHRGPSRCAVHTCEAVLSMAMAGLGIAVLPRSAAVLHVQSGLLEEVEHKTYADLGRHGIYVLTGSSERQDSVLRAFVKRVVPVAIADLRSLLDPNASHVLRADRASQSQTH